MARILVIDDDPIFRDAVTGLLKSGGHQVALARDGFVGMLRIKERSYDVILVDYQLPDMDGLSLARLLTESAASAKQKPVLIAIIESGDNLASRPGADQLFHSILPKAIAPQQLLALVASLPDREDGKENSDGAVQQFIASPSPASAMAAADEIWRANGLTQRPRAAVSRTLTANEQGAIALCFEIVSEQDADLLIVLDSSAALDAYERMAYSGRIPLIGLDPGDDNCDAVFVVGDRASWRDVAKKITEFSKSRSDTNPASAPMIDRLPQRSAPPLVPDMPIADQTLTAAIPLRPRTGEARLQSAEPAPRSAPRPGVVVTDTRPSGAQHVATLATGSLTPGLHEPPVRGATKSREAARVLVAESRGFIRQVVSDCLRQAGFDVVAAADFEQALRQVENETFDVLVVDEAMPSRCGQSVSLELRCAVVDGEALSIVGLVEKARLSPEAEWRSRGYDAMVTHPFRPEELLDRVRAQLARSNTTPVSVSSRSAIGELATSADETEVVQLCRSFLNLLQSATFDQGSYYRAPAKCRALANKLVATSGQLGFADLARLCRELANHNGSAADLSKILSALSRERDAAVATVSKWEHVAA